VSGLTYQLPKAFWIDHVERGCRCSELCPDRDAHEAAGEGYAFDGRETSKHFILSLSDLDAAELLSDSEHYTDAVRSMGPDFLGLQSSAKATVRAIRRTETEAGRN
jgi:hypothetical protein